MGQINQYLRSKKESNKSGEVSWGVYWEVKGLGRALKREQQLRCSFIIIVVVQKSGLGSNGYGGIN